MDYITAKINRIDDIIRHDTEMNQIKKDEVLQTLQLIHAQVKLLQEALDYGKNNTD